MYLSKTKYIYMVLKKRLLIMVDGLLFIRHC